MAAVNEIILSSQIEAIALALMVLAGVILNLCFAPFKAVAFDELNDEHARQENMTLPELKQVIRDIYPDLPPLYVIEFKMIA